MVTDAELVRAAQSGDSTAFRELVARYENKTYRLALKLVRDVQDAEDVLQETFINAFRHLDTFRGDAEFSTWIYRICTNASLMKLRSRKFAVSLDEPLSDDGEETQPRELADWSATPEELLLNGEIRAEMDAALSRLGESLRAVFVLRDVQGLSVQETAQVLDISVPNVKTRLHRARLALREQLATYLAEGRQNPEKELAK